MLRPKRSSWAALYLEGSGAGGQLYFENKNGRGSAALLLKLKTGGEACSFDVFSCRPLESGFWRAISNFFVNSICQFSFFKSPDIVCSIISNIREVFFDCTVFHFGWMIASAFPRSFRRSSSWKKARDSQKSDHLRTMLITKLLALLLLNEMGLYHTDKSVLNTPKRGHHPTIEANRLRKPTLCCLVISTQPGTLRCPNT